MKNTIKRFGFIAVAAVIGLTFALSLTGCNRGGGILGGKPTPLSANATLKQARDKVNAIVAYCDAHETVDNTAMKSLVGQIGFVLDLLSRTPTGTASWNESKDDYIEGINSVIAELE